MKGLDGKNWINGCSKEFSRIAQGRKNNNTKGTNTIFFIHSNKLSKNKKPTYLNPSINSLLKINVVLDTTDVKML